MGGPGSGNRWRYDTKATTHEYRALDVRRMARAGVLTPGYCGSWQWTSNDEVVGWIQFRVEHDQITLIYRYRHNGGPWKDQQYPVRLVRTPCKLGGSRPWFICPALGCGRRVAILYGGDVFACRRCHGLAYASTREDYGDRAARRADRLRVRLGWEPGILNGDSDKPKWMRLCTFHRLTAEHDWWVNRSMHAVALRFGFLDRVLPGMAKRASRVKP